MDKESSMAGLEQMMPSYSNQIQAIEALQDTVYGSSGRKVDRISGNNATNNFARNMHTTQQMVPTMGSKSMPKIH